MLLEVFIASSVVLNDSLSVVEEYKLFDWVGRISSRENTCYGFHRLSLSAGGMVVFGIRQRECWYESTEFHGLYSNVLCDALIWTYGTSYFEGTLRWIVICCSRIIDSLCIARLLCRVRGIGVVEDGRSNRRSGQPGRVRYSQEESNSSF